MGILMQEDHSDTQRLLARMAEGDREALADLFQQYRPRLRRMIQLRMDRRLQGRVDPSDVLQEAFLDVSRRQDDASRQAQSTFFVWLRMITGQKLLEIHRRHLGTQSRDAGREISLCREGCPEVSSQLLASQLLGRFSTASQAAMRAEQQARLEEILNQMEPTDREVLVLRHFEELSNAEIAEVLGLSKTAASNRYVRAIVRLKGHLNAIPGFFS